MKRLRRPAKHRKGFKWVRSRDWQMRSQTGECVYSFGLSNEPETSGTVIVGMVPVAVPLLGMGYGGSASSSTALQNLSALGLGLKGVTLYDIGGGSIKGATVIIGGVMHADLDVASRFATGLQGPAPVIDVGIGAHRGVHVEHYEPTRGIRAAHNIPFREVRRKIGRIRVIPRQTAVKTLRTFEGQVESIEGDAAIVSFAESPNGPLLTGQCRASMLATKNIGQRDKFRFYLRQIGDKITGEFEKIPRGLFSGLEVKVMRDRLAGIDEDG